MTTKNWLPLRPGGSHRGLGHRDHALGVGEVRGRLLVDAVAGAAGPVAGGSPPWITRMGRAGDAMEREPVVEALIGEEGERVDGLRRALGVEGDLEAPRSSSRRPPSARRRAGPPASAPRG